MKKGITKNWSTAERKSGEEGWGREGKENWNKIGRGWSKNEKENWKKRGIGWSKKEKEIGRRGV